MATYAIGDLQSCHDEFRQLLDLLRFDPGTDRLWLTGDLCGRGPKPLETLRLIKSLGHAVNMVLGNHDLHLLAQAAGLAPAGKEDPSFQPVLEAPDRDELLNWLRSRSILHLDPALGYGLIHAGLPPQWDTATAQACAHELETCLRGDDYRDFLAAMYGNAPLQWRADLQGFERLRFITNCFTRLRFCRSDGQLALQEKGPAHSRPDLHPWFASPDRRTGDIRWIFGHWSTLGQVHWPEYAVYGLDTGCIWGGALTALCLETAELTQLPCTGYKLPVQA